MKVRFLEGAKLDISSVAAYYEGQRGGLGLAFIEEVDRRASQIELFPLASTILEGPVRIAMLRRFPYGLIYRVAADEAIVTSVVHLHREPGTWKTDPTE